MVWKFPSQLFVVGVIAFFCATGASLAEPLGPSSGFLASYVGPQNGDLDIASGEAFRKGGVFEFDATFTADIGTTDGVAYVWGVDRGSNIAPFGAFRPGVLFDAVVIYDPSLSLFFALDLLTSAMTVLPLSDAVVTGSTLVLTVPASALPSTGFAPDKYLMNLWPRLGLDAADNTQIAQFAPSDSDVRVTNAPEPATVLLLGTGLLALGKRYRKSTGEGVCGTCV